jgi:uncharacterized phage protein gp47/JayE
MAAPKLKDLITSILSDLRNNLSVSTIIGKVVLNAIALVQGAKLKLYYLMSEFIYKNIFIDQADPEEQGGTLERLGSVYLGRTRNPATAGVYSLTVTGTPGVSIAPNTTFKSLDASASPDKLFILDNTFTFSATTGVITVRALDLGPEARLEINDLLQVTQPIANVDSFATVLSVDITPLEEESIEEYRARSIQAAQLESQGGAKSDYRLWSLDAQGVRTVYPYVNSPGIIDLYIEANFGDSIDGKGTPTQAILDDVEEVVEFDPDTTRPLEERGRRPMSAFQINFLAISVLDVDVQITGLSDTSYISSISSAISSYLFDIRPFIDGADSPNDSQKGLLYEADIYSVVRDVLGNKAKFTSLTVSVDGDLIQIYEFLKGNIPTLNSVTNV